MTDIIIDGRHYRLGSLCKRGHDWQDTGKSLRYIGGVCVECNKIRNQIWKQQSPEEVSKRRKAYYEQNRERLLADKRRDYAANPDKHRARIKEQRKKHREKRLAKYDASKRRTYYLSDREHVLQYSKEYYQQNKSSVLLRTKKWAQTPIGRQHRRINHKRWRAKKRASGRLHGNYTRKQWVERLEQFYDCCAYCGRSDCELTVDRNDFRF